MHGCLEELQQAATVWQSPKCSQPTPCLQVSAGHYTVRPGHDQVSMSVGKSSACRMTSWLCRQKTQPPANPQVYISTNLCAREPPARTRNAVRIRAPISHFPCIPGRAQPAPEPDFTAWRQSRLHVSRRSMKQSKALAVLLHCTGASQGQQKANVCQQP